MKVEEIKLRLQVLSAPDDDVDIMTDCRHCSSSSISSSSSIFLFLRQLTTIIRTNSSYVYDSILSSRTKPLPTVRHDTGSSDSRIELNRIEITSMISSPLDNIYIYIYIGTSGYIKYSKRKLSIHPCRLLDSTPLLVMG